MSKIIYILSSIISSICDTGQEMVLEKAILFQCSLALGGALFSGLKRKAYDPDLQARS